MKSAATHMGLASSTVSEQVKKFEDGHGLELFQRKGREMVLTPEGEKVFKYSKEIFGAGLRLQDAISFDDIGGYNAKVAIENDLESESIDHTLKEYWGRYSKFGLVETRRSKNLSQSIYFLENDVVDWFISSTELNDNKFESIKIADYEYSFYVSKEIYDRFRKSKKVLANLPLGMYGTNEELDIHIKDYLIQNDSAPLESFKSDHLSILKDLCLDSRIVIGLSSKRDFKYDGLVKLKFSSPFSFPVFAVWKRENGQLLYIRKLKESLGLLPIQ